MTSKLCTCQQKFCLLGGRRIGRVRREGKEKWGESINDDKTSDDNCSLLSCHHLLLQRHLLHLLCFSVSVREKKEKTKKNNKKKETLITLIHSSPSKGKG